MYLLLSLLRVAYCYNYACIIEKLIAYYFYLLNNLGNKFYLYSHKRIFLINLIKIHIEPLVKVTIYLLLVIIGISNLSLIRTSDLRRQLDLSLYRHHQQRFFDDSQCHVTKMLVVRPDYLRPYHLKT